MKNYTLRTLIFMALCCDLGLFSKRLIAPLANILTDSLHIPGGISTSFSLMFLVIAAEVISHRGCATIMGAVQSILAVSMGMVGSMGALSPIGYIVPGIAIDLILRLTKATSLSLKDRMVLANAAAGVCASLAANCIVFRLWGVPLLLYLSVAAVSGAVCGLLGAGIAGRIASVVRFPTHEKTQVI